MLHAPQTTIVLPLFVFRVSLLLPLVGLLIYAVILYLWTPAIPEAAATYERWWFAQELSSIENIQNWLGMLGLLIFVVGSAGLFVYKAWARTCYILAVIIIVLSEIPRLPVLVIGFQQLLDNIIGISVGLAIGLMYFCEDIKGHFSA